MSEAEGTPNPDSKIVGISSDTAAAVARTAAKKAEVEVVPLTAHEANEHFDKLGIPFGD